MLDERIERSGILHQSGDLDGAERVCRDVLRDRAGHPAALYRLGLIARDRGNRPKALELLARAARIDPSCAAIHSDLGRTLMAGREFPAAIGHLERALALDATRADDYLWLANCWAELGFSDRALEVCDRALRFRDDAEIAGRIAGAMMTQGRTREAIDVCRRAVEAHPSPAVHSCLLFSMHYVPDYSPEEIAAEHRRYSALYEAPLLDAPRVPAGSRVGGRPLRVGYVSADFRAHPVAQFLRPVLAHHHQERVEVFCYSATPAADAITREFQRMAGSNWRDILALPDDAAADLIRRDSIDVLVDTGGHTGHNRLMIFARKPAPVQITWLGYADTTGLRSIDYRITDAHADPRGLTGALHSEELIRLPSFLCYEAPGYIRPPGPLPALRNGFVTFGSFNNFMKLSPPAIEAWAAILRAVPGSRLMLKHRGAHDRAARDAFPALFESHGIARDRIVITLQMPAHNLHMESYGEIDIALDPWPYNGTTTSCEALAMGVPFVALAGRSHVARVGVSLLTQVGLVDWIANSSEEYVRFAVEKSADLDGLAALRQGLPGRLAASPLGDVERFVTGLEDLYLSVAK